MRSAFAEGTAYLAVDRHRNDDRRPYLFRTADYGATWKAVMGDLPPGGPVYVVRESPRKRRHCRYRFYSDQRKPVLPRNSD